MTETVPMAVRSLLDLERRGIAIRPPGTATPDELGLTPTGTTYDMAQEATWIDGDHYAVGRWDGSMSIFAFGASPFRGPLISTAVAEPQSGGVQAIGFVAPGIFVSANDASSFIAWTSARPGDWTSLVQVAVVRYDAKLGVVNALRAVRTGGEIYVLAGHENGYLSAWKTTTGTSYTYAGAVDLTVPQPVFGLQNIRGVEVLAVTSSTAYVVTVSENAWVSVVSVPDLTVRSRIMYNPEAQRGLNTVAVSGRNVLVGNCAVGTTDRNLWLLTVDPSDWQLTVADSALLRLPSWTGPQVFNFAVTWTYQGDRGWVWLASTQDGGLWPGTVTDGRLAVGTPTVLTPALGSALAWNYTGALVAVSYNLCEFTTAGAVDYHGEDPQHPLDPPPATIAPAG